MKLLAFETATEGCSVALWVDGTVQERFEVAPRRHAELALPWADALLAEAGLTRAQLDAVAVSRGPGAFTGVRLGVAIAQGIALALDIPVVTRSTLEVLAAGAAGQRPAADAADATPRAPMRVLAAIDARMGEVYAGAYELAAGGPVPHAGEVVAAPGDVTLPGDQAGWWGIGTGFAAAEGVLGRQLGSRLVVLDSSALPRAAVLASLAAAAFARGEASAPERVEPAYLRDQVAMTLVQQQAARSDS